MNIFGSSAEFEQDIIRERTKAGLWAAKARGILNAILIEVDNMEMAHSNLLDMKIRIFKGPLKIENEETWIYFADEDNNVVEYIQWFNKK